MIDGWYLLFEASTHYRDPASRTESGASASLPRRTTAEPSVIVLSTPRFPSQRTSKAVVDVPALEQLYAAYPNATFVLVDPPTPSLSSPTAAAAPSPDDSTCEPLEVATAPSLYSRPDVQRRTCWITVAAIKEVPACSTRAPSPLSSLSDLRQSITTLPLASRRHLVRLDPGAAAGLLQRHAWVKRLHELPTSLTSVEQIVAVLLQDYVMPLSMLLGAISKCEWVADEPTTAALLQIIAGAVRHQRSLPALVGMQTRQDGHSVYSPEAWGQPWTEEVRGAEDMRKRPTLQQDLLQCAAWTTTATTPVNGDVQLIAGHLSLNSEKMEAAATSRQHSHLIFCTAIGNQQTAAALLRRLLSEMEQSHFYISLNGFDITTAPSPYSANVEEAKRYTHDIPALRPLSSVAESNRLVEQFLGQYAEHYGRQSHQRDDDAVSAAIDMLWLQCTATLRSIHTEEYRLSLQDCISESVGPSPRNSQGGAEGPEHQAFTTASTAVILCLDECHMARLSTSGVSDGSMLQRLHPFFNTSLFIYVEASSPPLQEWTYLRRMDAGLHYAEELCTRTQGRLCFTKDHRLYPSEVSGDDASCPHEAAVRFLQERQTRPVTDVHYCIVSDEAQDLYAPASIGAWSSTSLRTDTTAGMLTVVVGAVQLTHASGGVQLWRATTAPSDGTMVPFVVGARRVSGSRRRVIAFALHSNSRRYFVSAISPVEQQKAQHTPAIQGSAYATWWGWQIDLSEARLLLLTLMIGEVQHLKTLLFAFESDDEVAKERAEVQGRSAMLSDWTRELDDAVHQESLLLSGCRQASQWIRSLDVSARFGSRSHATSGIHSKREMLQECREIYHEIQLALEEASRRHSADSPLTVGKDDVVGVLHRTHQLMRLKLKLAALQEVSGTAQDAGRSAPSVAWEVVREEAVTAPSPTRASAEIREAEVVLPGKALSPVENSAEVVLPQAPRHDPRIDVSLTSWKETRRQFNVQLPVAPSLHSSFLGTHRVEVPIRNRMQRDQATEKLEVDAALQDGAAHNWTTSRKRYDSQETSVGQQVRGPSADRQYSQGAPSNRPSVYAPYAAPTFRPAGPHASSGCDDVDSYDDTENDANLSCGPSLSSYRGCSTDDRAVEAHPMDTQEKGIVASTTSTVERDVRWSCFSPSATGSHGAAAPLVSSLSALMARRLPAISPMPISTDLLRVGKYCSGCLTLQVLQPALLTEATGQWSDPWQCTPQESSREAVGYLILLSVDAASAAMKVLEVLTCSQQRPSALKGGIIASHQSYQLRTVVTPDANYAVVYVGLARAPPHWINPSSILWMSGIAFAARRPMMQNLRVTGVEASEIQLSWDGAHRIKLLLAKVATAPPSVQALFAPGADSKEEDAAVVRVVTISPARVGELTPSSIYHISAVPLSSTSSTASAAAAAVQSPPPLPLLDIVDEEKPLALSILAATGLSPLSSLLQLEHLERYDSTGAAGEADAMPLVRAVVSYPLISYTALLPPSLAVRLAECLPEAMATGEQSPSQLQLSYCITPDLLVSGESSLPEMAMRGQQQPSDAELQRFTLVTRPGLTVPISVSHHLQVGVKCQREVSTAAPQQTLHDVVFSATQPQVLQTTIGPVHLSGKSVEVQKRGDGEVRLRWRGTSPSYRVTVEVVGSIDTCEEGNEKHPAKATEYLVQGNLLQGNEMETKGGALAHVFWLPLPYVAALCLPMLRQGSLYRARVSCATMDAGPVESTWATRPAPPPPRVCLPRYNSHTRQLHVCIVQQQQRQQHKLNASKSTNQPHEIVKGGSPAPTMESYLQFVLLPLRTSIELPATVSPSSSATTTERIFDCSVLPTNMPLRLVLYQVLRYRGVEAAASMDSSEYSDPLIFYIVSDVCCHALTTGTVADPVCTGVELQWTCGYGKLDVEDGERSEASVVEEVEFAEGSRIPVDCPGKNTLRLSTSQLQQLSGSSSGSGTITGADAAPGEWRGIVQLAGFRGAAPLVRDICPILLIPPPPSLVHCPELFQLYNYEDHAELCIHVMGLYRLYHKRYLYLRHASPAETTRVTAELMERVLLSILVVFAEGQRSVFPLPRDTIMDKDEAGPATDAAGVLLAEKSEVEIIRLPLPAYRPFDGQLQLYLQLDIAEYSVYRDGSQQAKDRESEKEEEEGSSAACVLLVPQSTSLVPAIAAVPPAEPIDDFRVTVRSTTEVEVTWAPPPSLTRHRRTHPDMPVQYEVQVVPAHLMVDGRTEPQVDGAELQRCVTRGSRLTVAHLRPAMPYTIYIRGTGLGDYYAMKCVVLPPLLLRDVASRIAASLHVEQVTTMAPTAASRIRRPGARPSRAIPILCGLLPQSVVRSWECPVQSSAVGPKGIKRGRQAPATQQIVTQMHYTAALISQSGELLRQWTSTPDKATPMSYELAASAASYAPLWPHVELMVAMEIAGETAVSTLSSGLASTPSGVLVPPPEHLSGLHHRLRVDIVCQPRLLLVSREGCIVGWEGSCKDGYSVSWCLSSAIDAINTEEVWPSSENEAKYPYPTEARSPPVAPCRIHIPIVAEALQETTAPIAIFVYIAARAPLTNLSNSTCIAFLLPIAPPDVVVLRHTARITTVQVPPSHQCSTTAEDQKRSSSMQKNALQARVLQHLQSHWTVVAGDVAAVEHYGTTAVNGSDDMQGGTTRIVPWGTRSDVQTAPRDSFDAVEVERIYDIHWSASTDGVFLQCTQSRQRCESSVWADVVLHLQQAHRRCTGALDDDIEAGVDDFVSFPVLRWLRPSVGLRQAMARPSLCMLKDLRISAFDEDHGLDTTKQSMTRATLPTDGEVYPVQAKVAEGSGYDATVQEIQALQQWRQAGHPTLRTSLWWTSNDTQFTVSLLGPFSAMAQCVAPSDAGEQDDGAHPSLGTTSASVAGCISVLNQIYEAGDVSTTSVLPLSQLRLNTFHEKPVPSALKVPHRRVYTCFRSTPLLSCELMDKVHHHETVEMPCCTMELGGLLPEQFYCIQVTGANSGDEVLRAQLLTPPSCVGTLIMAECSDDLSPVSATTRLTIRARCFNPHAFPELLREDEAEEEPEEEEAKCTAASSVLVTSSAHLDVVNARGRQISHHLLYKRGDPGWQQQHATQDVMVYTSLDEEEQASGRGETFVELRMVLEMCITMTDTCTSILSPCTWGPLLTAAPSPSQQDGSLCRCVPLTDELSLRCTIPLCRVPSLPRMRCVRIRRRSSNSLRLGLRWHSGGGAAAPSQGLPHRPSKPPHYATHPTMLRVTAVSASSLGNDVRRDGVPAAPPPHSFISLLHTTSTAVTLSPLQPATLYRISFYEVDASSEAAGVAPQRTTSARTDLPHSSRVARYAVQPLPLPDAMQRAVRALARVSSRPPAILVLQRQPSPQGAVEPRGAFIFYAMTAPTLPLTPRITTGMSVEAGQSSSVWQRAPGCLLLMVPPPPLTWIDDARVLHYTVALVMPEKKLFIPGNAYRPLDEGLALDPSTKTQWWKQRLASAFREGMNVKWDATPVETAEEDAQHHWGTALLELLESSVQLCVVPIDAEKVPFDTWKRPSKRSSHSTPGTADTSEVSFLRIPISEPVIDDNAINDGAALSASNGIETCSATVHLLRCFDAALVVKQSVSSGPPSFTGTAHHGGALLGSQGCTADVGAGSLIAFAQSPLSIRPLQPIHKVQIRMQRKGATVTWLHEVCWKWRVCGAAPLQAAGIKDGKATATFKARLQCEEVPVSDVDKQIASRNGSLGAPCQPSDPARGNVVMTCTVATETEVVSLPQLAPSTLHRLSWQAVRCNGWMACEPTSVFLLTAPSPPVCRPALHYTLHRDAGKKGKSKDACVVDVLFHLPAAVSTPQGFPVYHEAILVNLDEVDVDACHSARDPIAATASQASLNCYCNKSPNKSLRITVHLHCPQQHQQRYAIAFFTVLRHRQLTTTAEPLWCSDGGDVLPVEHQGYRRLQPPHCTAVQPQKRSRKGVVYSAPLLSILDNDAILRIASTAKDFAEGAAEDAAATPRPWRRIRLRPSQLCVKTRTVDRMVVAWKLDTTAVCLTDAELALLFRDGLFKIVFDPIVDGVWGAVPTEQGCGDGALRTAAAASPFEESGRDAFYRENIGPTEPPVAPSASDTALPSPLVPFVAYRSVKEAIGCRVDSLNHDAASTETRNELSYEVIYSCPSKSVARAGYRIVVSLHPSWQTGVPPSPDVSLSSPPLADEYATELLLTPVVTPQPVQRILVQCVTPTSCVVRWTVPEQIASTPSSTTYRVEYGLRVRSAESMEADSTWATVVDAGIHTSVRLTDLQPRSAYTVRVVPCSEIGECCVAGNAVASFESA